MSQNWFGEDDQSRVARWLLDTAQFLFGAFWKALLWGMGFLLASIVLPVDLDDRNSIILKNFFHELGFAFIIAALIAVGIEEVARRKQNALVASQIATMNRNVIEAVYERRFPKSIFRHIERSVLEFPFLRRDVDVTVELEFLNNGQKQKGEDGIILVNFAVKASVVNTSREAAKYIPKLFIECPWKKRLLKYCLVKRVTINDKNLTDKEIKEADERVKNTDDIWFFSNLNL